MKYVILTTLLFRHLPKSGIAGGPRPLRILLADRQSSEDQTVKPKSIFDIRKQVLPRILEHTIVLSTMGVALLLIGRWMLPTNFVWELSVRTIESWNGWSFVAMILIGAGIFNILKSIVFVVRSVNASGEWHFRLTYDELLWKVPQHSFGPEVGFETKLSDTKEVEFRTITAYEERDVREYWIHFRDGTKIQLMDHTGYTLSWLVSEIHKAGVHYNETLID